MFRETEVRQMRSEFCKRQRAREVITALARKHATSRFVMESILTHRSWKQVAFTAEEVQEIKRLIESGAESHRSLARYFNTTTRRIRRLAA